MISFNLGEVLQTLRGHTDHVLFVAFDSERILSVSSDNSIRLYRWGDQAVGPQDKYYVLGENETLVDVHKATGTAVSDIMKWNDIKNTRQLHPGSRIIIAKGNPDEPTKAEKLAMEREHRMAGNRATMGEKGSGGIAASDLALLRPTRLQMMMKEDFEEDSLANRLFGQAKKDVELFPTSLHVSDGAATLSTRLIHPYDRHRAGRDFLGYFRFSADNVDEWGHASDSLMLAMLDIYVEREVLTVVKELLHQANGHETVGGRIRNLGRRPMSAATNNLTRIDELDEN